MSKLSLVGFRRLLVDLLSCDSGFIQFDIDKSKVFLKKHVYDVRVIVDQKGFGERKLIAQNRTIQLH